MSPGHTHYVYVKLTLDQVRQAAAAVELLSRSGLWDRPGEVTILQRKLVEMLPGHLQPGPAGFLPPLSPGQIPNTSRNH